MRRARPTDHAPRLDLDPLPHPHTATPTANACLTNDYTELDDYGLPPGRDCPACGEPLEPGHIDNSIALVCLCPTHGFVERTEDPLSDTE